MKNSRRKVYKKNSLNVAIYITKKLVYLTIFFLVIFIICWGGNLVYVRRSKNWWKVFNSIRVQTRKSRSLKADDVNYMRVDRQVSRHFTSPFRFDVGTKEAGGAISTRPTCLANNKCFSNIGEIKIMNERRSRATTTSEWKTNFLICFSCSFRFRSLSHWIISAITVLCFDCSWLLIDRYSRRSVTKQNVVR